MYEFEKKKLYNYLGKGLVETFKKHKCIVAGGTITSLFCNRDINDVDVYFKSQDSLIAAIEEFWEDGNWIIAHTKKATLYSVGENKQVQFIHLKYFDKAEDVFDTFDFTVCMGAFDFETEEFILHEDFLKHNSQRILKFNGSTLYPIVSALRSQKYEDKGYNISKPEYIRILLACMNLKLTSYKELKEQMGGMYGINYDKMFKDMVEDDSKFDLGIIIEKLKDINLSEDYFVKPERIDFDDVDDLIENIMEGYKKKYFVIGDTYYRVKYNGDMDVSHLDESDIDDSFELIDGEKFIGNLRVYKFVKKVGDRYFSFYDDKYEYIIGATHCAKTNKGEYGAGLYFNQLKNIPCSSYSNREDKVLLEAKFSPEDISQWEISDAVKLNRCIITREVPKEEYEKFM